MDDAGLNGGFVGENPGENDANPVMKDHHFMGCIPRGSHSVGIEVDPFGVSTSGSSALAPRSVWLPYSHRAALAAVQAGSSIPVSMTHVTPSTSPQP